MQKPPILFFGANQLDLDAKETLAITLTANNYEQPERLNSSFTNTFTIPFTGNNLGIVGALMAGERSEAQYTRQKSTLLIAGAQSQFGSLYIFQGEGNTFDASFISGIADFFDDLGDASLWCLFNANTFANTRAGYIAQIVNTYVDGFSTGLASFGTLATSGTDININRLYPFPYFWQIIQDIATFAGWTCGTGELLADTGFQSVCIAYNGEAYNETLYFSYKTIWGITAGAAPGNFLTINGSQNIASDFNMTALITNDRFDPVAGKMQLSADDCGGKIFYFTSPLTITTNAGQYDYEIRISAYTGFTHISTLASFASGLVVGQPATVNTSITLISDWTDIAGYDILVEVRANVGLQFSFSDAIFRFCDGRDTYTDLLWGSTDVMPYASLPNLKMSDFVKAVCNMFGAIPRVDGLAKTIDFVKFNTIFYNTANEQDWTGKLDGQSGIKKEWKYGPYGKINIAQYDNDKDVPAGFGSGQMLISNSNLIESYNWLKIPFASSLTKDFADALVRFAYIPVYDVDDNPQKLKPRCAKVLFEDLATIGIVDNSGTTNVTQYNVARFGYQLNDQISLSFQGPNNLLTIYHGAFANMVGRMEKVTANFALKANDIASIDFFAPVFIDQVFMGVHIQGRFILQKVREWDGYSTVEVELLKINY